MGKTIAEKILSQKSGVDARANDIVIANLDFIMGQDGTSTLAIQAFEDMAGQKAFDASKVAMVIDHSAPSPLEGVSALHARMRGFARNQGINFYDIGEGVCHQLMLEKGHAVPGSLVVGLILILVPMEHINAFATGVGSTDRLLGLFLARCGSRYQDH